MLTLVWLSGAVGGMLFGLGIGSAHADQGSYLAAAHADPVLAGSSDFWLMVVGSKACAGVYHENWGPAYAAVIRIAHQELCP